MNRAATPKLFTPKNFLGTVYDINENELLAFYNAVNKEKSMATYETHYKTEHFKADGVNVSQINITQKNVGSVIQVKGNSTYITIINHDGEEITVTKYAARELIHAIARLT